MNAFAAFIVRLVGYAVVLGIVARVADALWAGTGLDGVGALHGDHDRALTILAVAPLALGLTGTGPFARPAVFVAGFLSGAALCAPFAVARSAGW